MRDATGRCERGERSVGRYILLLLCWVVITALPEAGEAQAADLHVGGWSLTANGRVVQDFAYSGHCPVALRFAWSVVSAVPTDATYIFTRDDGSTTLSERVAVAGAGRSTSIYTDWQLGADGPDFSNYHGWEELVIESPTRVTHRINFTVHCRNNPASSEGGPVNSPGTPLQGANNACSPRCIRPAPAPVPPPKRPANGRPPHELEEPAQSNSCYVSLNPPQSCTLPGIYDVGTSCYCIDSSNENVTGTIWQAPQ